MSQCRRNGKSYNSFEDLKEQGGKLDPAISISLIDALAKAGCVDAAFELYEEMIT